MFHHTKTKGDLGVIAAQYSLTKQGWLVCLPQTEHSPFDIVVYKDGIFKRIQVKYKKPHNGCLQYSHCEKYIGEVDIICFYNPENEECYFVPLEGNQKCVTIRVTPSRNNQSVGVKLAEDYLLMPL